MANCPKHPGEDLVILSKKIFPTLAGDTYKCPNKDGDERCDFRMLVSEAENQPIPKSTAVPLFFKKKKDPAVASPVVELRTVTLVNPLSQEAPLTLNALAMPREGYPDRNPASRKERDQAELAKSSIEPIAEMHDRAARKEREESEAPKREVVNLVTLAVESDDGKPNDLASAREAFAKVDIAPRRPPPPMSAFERAQNAFIDGPIATLGECFVALYLSTRKHDGSEAAAALEACRAAFDACNLELADIEVRRSPKASVTVSSKSEVAVKRAKKRIRSKHENRKTAAKGKK